MKKMFTSCLLAASAALMSGCHGNESAAPAALQTAHARVVESQQQQVPLNVHATGTVHARETAVVSAQVVGRIQQVLVREGDSVRAGQTLVVLDDAALRASVEQAQAGVKAAQDEQAAAQTDAKLAASTLDRYRQLQAEKSVSPQEMDEVAQRAEASVQPDGAQPGLQRRGFVGEGPRRPHCRRTQSRAQAALGLATMGWTEWVSRGRSVRALPM